MKAKWVSRHTYGDVLPSYIHDPGNQVQGRGAIAGVCHVVRLIEDNGCWRVCHHISIPVQTQHDINSHLRTFSCMSSEQ